MFKYDEKKSKDLAKFFAEQREVIPSPVLVIEPEPTPPEYPAALPHVIRWVDEDQEYELEMLALLEHAMKGLWSKRGSAADARMLMAMFSIAVRCRRTIIGASQRELGKMTDMSSHSQVNAALKRLDSRGWFLAKYRRSLEEVMQMARRATGSQRQRKDGISEIQVGALLYPGVREESEKEREFLSLYKSAPTSPYVRFANQLVTVWQLKRGDNS